MQTRGSGLIRRPFYSTMGRIGSGPFSETVKIQFMVALHGSVRPHVCHGRARQRTVMSMNSRMAFAIQRFLSRKSCISVGAAGKGIPMPIASLCFGGPRGWFFGWFLCGGVVVLAIERRKGG